MWVIYYWFDVQDVFMRKIGWTEEAARKAEEESKNILKPFM